MKISINAALFLTAVSCVSSPAFAGHYVYTDVQVDGAIDTIAGAINVRGQFVGIADPRNSSVFPFTYSAGKTRSLPVALSLGDVNAHGLSVGTDGVRPIVYNIDTNTSTPLPTPRGYTVAPGFISDGGIIVGEAYDAQNHTFGYLYAAGKATILTAPGSNNFTSADAVNATGQVAGTYVGSDPAIYGFIYTKGKFTKFAIPGSLRINVAAIDASGRVVGSYDDNFQGQHGFVLTKGHLQTIDYPGGGRTSINGFGPGGELIGNVAIGFTAAHGFILSNGKFTQIDRPPTKVRDVASTGVSGINASATLSGNYSTSNGQITAFIAVCPASQEPCTRQIARPL